MTRRLQFAVEEKVIFHAPLTLGRTRKKEFVLRVAGHVIPRDIFESYGGCEGILKNGFEIQPETVIAEVGGKQMECFAIASDDRPLPIMIPCEVVRETMTQRKGVLLPAEKVSHGGASF